MSGNSNDNSQNLLTFGGHLELMRKMLFRMVGAVSILACIIFCFKSETFEILLAPHRSNFITFTFIERLAGTIGWKFHFEDFNVPLIATELSSQFMTHITSSCILGALLASPCSLF